MIASVGESADFSWRPDAVPAGFLVNSRETPELFVDAAKSILQNGKASSNLAKGIAIARHLGSREGDGTPIQSNTKETYRRIVRKGDGYCSDYTQVFNALAIASNIPVREWGMSFDGFSGDGHAFNEIYDERHKKWVLFDSYWSFYARDAVTKIPFSIFEFKDLLDGRTPRDSVEIVRISPERFAFKSDEYLMDYYRRGINQLYLYWGNNVFDYDAHPLVQAASKISRAAEQASAILIGLHPEIRILPNDSNEGDIAKLWQIRYRFLLMSALMGALAIVLVVEVFLLVRRRSRAAGRAPGRAITEKSG